MKYTSSEAAKLLRKLNEELSSLTYVEAQSRTFTAAVGEDAESVRPEYDFADCQRKIYELEKKIRKIKHAINVFNTTHKVDGFDMTIDEMLIYLPQLSEQKDKLSHMSCTLPRQRKPSGGSSNIIEYNYANYDIKAAAEEYAKISDTLSKAQLALDILNTTETMEIDV